VPTFVTTDEDEGTRLDVVLVRLLPAVSRSQIQHLIREGHVRLGRGQAKTGLVVNAGLHIEVTLPAPVAAVPEAEVLPLSILYDDQDIVVVDKPAGMVVHPGAGHARGTLVNALLHHTRGLSGIGGVERPGIVHRLDRGTSGVMVIAKHDQAHRHLSQQFHDRQVVKEYVAVVWGTPLRGQTMTKPIGRDPNMRSKMSSRARRGRAALTRIEDVESLDGVSFIRTSIGTGRTHQIRVHLSEAGHAVVGDRLYGGVRPRLPGRFASIAALERPFLHAHRLSFAHPSDGRPMTFTAPLPDDLTSVLAALRRRPRRE
jgi:23S rRNA pseudouridine1911/1915/1917 synthase